MIGISLESFLRGLGSTPMPVTIRQLEDRKLFYSASILHGVSAGYIGWVIKDTNQYWLSETAITEGLADAQKEMKFWQERISYLEAQREVLTKKNATQVAIL